MTVTSTDLPPESMPTAQQMAIIDLIEDIATWLEESARGGRLSHRLRMADQLRTGAWRSMRRRRGAPADVARARAVMAPIPVPWYADNDTSLSSTVQPQWGTG
jgi:hypothetical protein